VEPSSTTGNSWPRFIVIEGKDDNLQKLSPFAICKGFQSTCGDPQSVKTLRSGCLLVECATPKQSFTLLKLHKIVNQSVTVTPHKTLNTCKGVVRSRDFQHTDESEMLLGLKDQGVTQAQRIDVRRGDGRVPTNTYILTFNTQKNTTFYQSWVYTHHCRGVYSQSSSLFKCQRFGHHQDTCKREAVCSRYRVAKPAYTKSVSVQTDMTWPEQLPTFALLPSTQKTMKTVSSTQTTTVTHPKTATGKTSAAKPSVPPKPTKNKVIAQTPTALAKITFEPPVTPQQRPRITRSNGQKKGSDDPIQLHNCYGSLMESDDPSLSFDPLSPSKHKHSPHKPNLITLDDIME
ncbi:hypothetical protein ScPMuIL_015044, partial [Solemya velum]